MPRARPATAARTRSAADDAPHVLKGEKHHQPQQQRVPHQMNRRLDFAVHGLAAYDFDEHEHEAAAVQPQALNIQFRYV